MSASQRAKLYLVASYLGAAATCLLILSLAFEWPDFVRGFSIGVLLVSLFMLLRRGLRDEYFDELWKAGASMAFVAAVAWFLLAEGVAHGLGGVEGRSYWPQGMTGVVAIAAFFIGFHAKRLQSR
ncbi:hypothetical protein [Pelagerythrobacter aerophilus]